jgi:uncharacterized membrane protein
MDTIIFYALALILLVTSLIKSKEKTLKALLKAWRAFENILPQFLFVLPLVGFMLALLSPTQISALIGDESGFLGLSASILIGSITLIPGFVAFPTAALLLQNGAGYMQMGGFISSLMMVGIVTLPIDLSISARKLRYLGTLLPLSFPLLSPLLLDGWCFYE